LSDDVYTRETATMLDSSPGDHVYNPRTASPALKAAIADLAERTSRPAGELAGITLGEAFELAQDTYGDDLPEFWRIWQSWNVASFEPPAAMGDL
jgi:hypothetical protein